MRTEDEQLNWLIKTYFSDPRKRQTLAAGEVLITAGEPNRRLYLVLSGCLAGYSQGEGEEIFKAEPGDFAGILSFFSGERIATTWVRAVCHSEVAYIDRDQQPVPPNDDLDAQFMPVVVRALVGRQQHIQELAEERAEVMGRLQDVEKLASLGQMAAGVAHELNNAISVLSHGTKHLAEEIPERLATLPELHRRFLRLGIEQGRRISSREVRARLPKFERDLGLSRPAARSLARTGIEEGACKAARPRSDLEDPGARERGGGARDARRQIEIEEKVLTEPLARREPVPCDDVAERRQRRSGGALIHLRWRARLRAETPLPAPSAATRSDSRGSPARFPRSRSRFRDRARCERRADRA